jgi:hypothetical protein
VGTDWSLSPPQSSPCPHQVSLHLILSSWGASVLVSLGLSLNHT